MKWTNLYRPGNMNTGKWDEWHNKRCILYRDNKLFDVIFTIRNICVECWMWALKDGSLHPILTSDKFCLWPEEETKND